MPQYDWSKMTARERDVLVWTKVFGCSEPEWRDGEPYYSDLASVTIPNYSTDISAAWEVLRKFHFYNIQCGQEEFSGKKIYAVDLYSDVWERLGSAIALNEVDAICKAALRAKGVGV